VRYREVGGARVSVVGLGTWQFGSLEWGYGDAYAESEAAAIVARALDLGVNLVDTAEVYGGGRSERVVGRAIAGRRDEAFVATKVWPVLPPVAAVVERRGRASAARLGVDVIDLYQVHWPNPLVPLRSTMAGMRRLQDEGVVRHVGVSNFSLDRWQAAERALGSPVLANQVRYSLVARKPERELLSYAAASDRLVIAYSPLAQGLLSGNYSASNRPSSPLRQASPAFLPENLDRASQLLRALAEVAAVHEATSAQVALAWVLRRPNTVVIPGARTVEQLEANARAADLDLTDAEDAVLTAAADAFHPASAIRAAPSLLRRHPADG
jgi:aryl-alcohol dehydrogenase-like predicted oxidoreductase